jgi:hypothetical protein
MNDILQFCVHVSLPHPARFFLISYSCVPSPSVGSQYYVRNYVSSDVNGVILAFEELWLHH